MASRAASGGDEPASAARGGVSPDIVTLLRLLNAAVTEHEVFDTLIEAGLSTARAEGAALYRVAGGVPVLEALGPKPVGSVPQGSERVPAPVARAASTGARQTGAWTGAGDAALPGGYAVALPLTDSDGAVRGVLLLTYAGESAADGAVPESFLEALSRDGGRAVARALDPGHGARGREGRTDLDDIDRLLRSEARYRGFLQAAPDPIVTIDAEGVIADCNDAALAVSGYPADRLVGNPFVRFIPKEMAAAVEAAFARVLAGDSQQFRTEYVRADGERRGLSVRAVPITERDEITRVLAVLRDVSEDEELQAKMIQSEKLAALGELVSGVAHELNNPLAGIINFAELVLMEPLPEKQREPISLIKAEAERAARIVRNLLTFARGYRPERTLVDVNEVLDRALVMRDYGLATEDIKVVKRYSRVVHLWADPVQLQQVFLNLILNAEQAMLASSGSGTLTLATESTPQVVRVIVSDTGPGVPPEIRDRIFDPFFSTKKPGVGTGLGLSISYGIVSEMGGTVACHEEPGGGARFVVELPLESTPAGEAEAGAAEAATEAADEPAPRVLVVDDEPSVRRSVARLLERRGYSVEVAADGAAALEILGRREFDVVLADVRMPGMNGAELLAALRDAGSPLAERVIFASGDVVNERTADFLRACGRPSIQKPFELSALETLLTEVAGGR